MGVHEEVVVTKLRTDRGDLVDMSIERLQIRIADRTGVHLDAVIDFKSVKLFGSLEIKGDLPMVQDLKTEDILSLMAEACK